MAWYAYCIAERNAFPELCRHRRPMPLTGVTGLFGNQTFLFPASDLAVIVSEHTPEDAARMDQNAAKDHARVIADCFKLSTVLPFRFGTSFPDDDSLRRSVRSNQRHFTANVERLRGKAEMHLKVLVDDTCPGNSARDMTVGQQYLTSLRESAMAIGADASYVPADCRGNYVQADGFGQDAAGYRSPDRQQNGGAISE
jgi:hypothetical protein